MAASGDGFLLFPQIGGEWLRLEGRRLERHSFASRFGDFADAVRLADGRLLIVTRKFGLSGLDKHIVRADVAGSQLRLQPVARIGLGARENIEGIAAEPRVLGGTRLWLITDNDFRPRKATLLVALDLP